jgi:hypothetical protein
MFSSAEVTRGTVLYPWVPLSRVPPGGPLSNIPAKMYSTDHNADSQSTPAPTSTNTPRHSVPSVWGNITVPPPPTA